LLLSDRYVLIAFYVVLCQDASVEAAIDELSARTDDSARGKAPLAPQQPLLFKTQGIYYVKVDRNAVKVGEVASFSEAVEFLLMTFYVFNVSFPHHLKLAYGFFEHILGLPLSIGRTVTLTSFISRVAKIK